MATCSCTVHVQGSKSKTAQSSDWFGFRQGCICGNTTIGFQQFKVASFCGALLIWYSDIVLFLGLQSFANLGANVEIVVKHSLLQVLLAK